MINDKSIHEHAKNPERVKHRYIFGSPIRSRVTQPGCLLGNQVLRPAESRHTIGPIPRYCELLHGFMQDRLGDLPEGYGSLGEFLHKLVGDHRLTSEAVEQFKYDFLDRLPEIPISLTPNRYILLGRMRSMFFTVARSSSGDKYSWESSFFFNPSLNRKNVNEN